MRQIGIWLFLVVIICMFAACADEAAVGEGGTALSSSGITEQRLETTNVAADDGSVEDPEEAVVSEKNREDTFVADRWYNDQVLVLTYHHISDDFSSEYTLSPAQFSQHMQFLKENHFQPISLETFRMFLKHRAPVPENAVLITFDDGYESFYNEAFPVLKEYGFPAVAFVIVDRMRDSIRRESENEIPKMTWRQLRELSETDLISVASHTFNLHHLHPVEGVPATAPSSSPEFEGESERVYRSRLYVDFAMSRSGLEKIIERSVPAISLPYGYVNPYVRDVARDVGFELCFTSHYGIVSSDTDPYDIPRNHVGKADFDLKELQRLFQQYRSSDDHKEREGS